MIFRTIVAFIFGSCVGSFLNVCIWRLPRNKSIITPRSYCPHCQTPIRGYDNIPLISYFALKGRCRNCGRRISPRYFMVELITGALFAYFYTQFFAEPVRLIIYLIFVAALIAVTFIDFEHQIIPDRITYPGVGLGLVLSFLYPALLNTSSRWEALLNSFLGAFLGFVSLLLIGLLGKWIFKKEAMGGGDLKLLAMIGAFLGWEAVFLIIFVSSLVGSVVGLTLLSLRKKKRLEYIPFGPYLALAALVVIFKGQAIIDWYFRIF